MNARRPDEVEFTRLLSDVRFQKMKSVLKKQIPEYANLSTFERWKIRKLAEKEVSKKHTAIAYLVGFLVCVFLGLIQRFLREKTGNDDYWIVPYLLVLPLVIFLSFIWDIFVLNPRIKQVMEQQPNQNLHSIADSARSERG